MAEASVSVSWPHERGYRRRRLAREVQMDWVSWLIVAVVVLIVIFVVFAFVQRRRRAGGIVVDRKGRRGG